MQIEINPSMFFDQDLLEQTAEQLKDEILDAQVIPKDQGTLEGSLHAEAHPELRRADIAVSAPYARRLYYNPESVPIRGHERKSAEVKEHVRNGHTIKAHFRKGGTVKTHTASATNFRHGENPNAKDHWFEYWEPGGSLEGRAAQIYSDLWKKKYGGGT